MSPGARTDSVLSYYAGQMLVQPSFIQTFIAICCQVCEVGHEFIVSRMNRLNYAHEKRALASSWMRRHVFRVDEKVGENQFRLKSHPKPQPLPLMPVLLYFDVLPRVLVKRGPVTLWK